MASNIETLRKILVTGLGTALMTEEGLMKLLSDLKLPREAKNYVTAQAKKRKGELSKIIGAEVKRFLSRVNIQQELRKALTGLKIDIHATIHIDQKRPNVKITKARVNRQS